MVVRNTPFVDFVIKTRVLSTDQITALLGIAPDEAEDSSDGESTWRLRFDKGVLFTGSDERIYLGSLQINSMMNRLTPIQDELAALRQRLQDEESWRPHMFLHVVTPSNGPEEKHRSDFVVYEKDISVLAAIGVRLMASNEPMAHGWGAS